MNKIWLIILAVVFLITMVGVAFLIRQQQQTPSLEVEPETIVGIPGCVGCAGLEDERPTGLGRIPGESVELPDGQVDAPAIIVSVAENCDYCAVPVATVSLALSRDDLSVCENRLTPSLALVGPREVDVVNSEWLLDGFPSDLAHSGIFERSEAWRRVLSTDVIPSVTVVNAQSEIVGQWDWL